MEKVNIKKLAQFIISLNLVNDTYVPQSMTFECANKIVLDFYDSFFEGKRKIDIKKYESKISYIQKRKLKKFEGFQGNIGFNLNKIEKVFNEVSIENNSNLLISLTHEKNHAFQNLNQGETNEVIPSFFELYHSVLLDPQFNGIKNSDINYKISNAKKVAREYLFYTKLGFKDKSLQYHVNYMLDFYRSFILLKLYFEDQNKIKNALDKNIFEDLNLDAFKRTLYLDDDLSNLENIDKFIRKLRR